MKPEITKLAKDFIMDMQTRSSVEIRKIKINEELIGKSGLKPPAIFNKSSKIFIAYSDNDKGENKKNSAELNQLQRSIKILNENNEDVNSLNRNEKYKIILTVRNTGDLVVPSAKIEFFVANGDVGTRISNYAVTKFRRIGIKDCWLNPNSSIDISMDFIPDFDHLTIDGRQLKRLLVFRIFSFSPLDLPVLIDRFDIHDDRHIGYKWIF